MTDLSMEWILQETCSAGLSLRALLYFFIIVIYFKINFLRFIYGLFSLYLDRTVKYFGQEVRRSEEVGRGSGNDSRPESNLCPRGHCSP